MRIKHPEWRDSREPTHYPFSDNATLVNDDNLVLFPDTFLDAAFYPVGGKAGGYISQIDITTSQATIWYGDDEAIQRAYGQFDLASPTDNLRFVDTAGRPAGLIVSEALRMAVFQSWPIGEHEFTQDQASLVTAVCLPAPELGVRGIQVDDGTVLTGDVYIVGGDGVIVSCSEVTEDGNCEAAAATHYEIKFDIVGDPLWRRSECAPGLFTTPRFLESVTFQKGPRSLQCGPGTLGNLKLLVGNTAAEDTILRIRPTDSGVVIEAVGERLEDIKN